MAQATLLQGIDFVRTQPRRRVIDSTRVVLLREADHRPQHESFI
jgi:hypothetical protein